MALERHGRPPQSIAWHGGERSRDRAKELWTKLEGRSLPWGVFAGGGTLRRVPWLSTCSNCKA